MLTWFSRHNVMPDYKRTRGIVLCADDYGISPGVNDAILELLRRKRISATSCMTICSSWHEYGPLLNDFRQEADIGLHFTLTDFAPLGKMPLFAPDGRFPTFQKVFQMALQGQLLTAPMQKEIGEELQRQLRAFELVLGFPPAHIDGHQHIHQLNGVIDAIVSIYKTNNPANKPSLRICTDSLFNLIKRENGVIKSILLSLAGQRARNLAVKHGIHINNGFSGIYEFSGKKSYADLFAKFLRGIEDGGLILCHPGIVDQELIRVDSLTTPREEELRYLLSERFPKDLVSAGVYLTSTRISAKQRLEKTDYSRPIVENIEIHHAEIHGQAGGIRKQLGTVGGNSQH